MKTTTPAEGWKEEEGEEVMEGGRGGEWIERGHAVDRCVVSAAAARYQQPAVESTGQLASCGRCPPARPAGHLLSSGVGFCVRNKAVTVLGSISSRQCLCACVCVCVCVPRGCIRRRPIVGACCMVDGRAPTIYRLIH